MSTLKDLIRECAWTEVAAALVATHPDAASSLGAYRSVFEELGRLQPQPGRSPMRIVVEHESVCGKDGTLLERDDSEVGPETPPIEVPYAISWVPWDEWLGMRIDDRTLEVHPGSDILAHCLWDMTFDGFTQETVQEFAAGILRAASAPVTDVPSDAAAAETSTEDPLAVRAPIPSEFLSTRTGAPLDKCVVCETQLFPHGPYYMIEKNISNSGPRPELLYEYAICLSCQQKLMASFSSESRQRLDEYLAPHLDPEARRSRFLAEAGTTVGPWIRTCALNGTPVLDDEEYQISAFCEGGSIIFMGMPFALGAVAIREMEELLSPETRWTLERWMREFLDMPPGWKGIRPGPGGRPTP